MPLKPSIRGLISNYPYAWTLGLQARRRLNRLLRRPFNGEFRVLEKIALPEGTVIADIGANVGEAVEAFRLFKPDMAIAAFEPAAATFAQLDASTRHLQGVERHNVALGAAPGGFTLYTPVFKGVPLSPLASIDRDEAAEWLSKFASPNLDPAKLQVAEEQVEVRTLDSYGYPVSLMKLDVQGAEKQVLEGAVDTMRAHAPIIMAERAENDGVAEYLAGFGYVAHRLVDGTLQVADSGNDSIFLLPDHAARIEWPRVA